ncbi:MAG: hypothetical protein WAM30_19030, partial [Candidatus Dormiibacterota bacterium]
ANVFVERGGSLFAGGIRAAVDTMVLEAERAREERAKREAVQRLIQVTDRMIAELEELNLREVPRVPDELRMRARLVFAGLGFEPRPSLPVAPTPTQLIDSVFDAQQIVFELKADPEPAAAPSFGVPDAPPLRAAS